VEDAARPGDASTDLHHGEAAHSDDLDREQSRHRDGHRPRRLEGQKRHAETGREERGLAHDHGGLVHDHGGKLLVERKPVAHEVGLDRLIADRGRRR